MGTVVSTWSVQNPAQAATLLGTLPAGTALDDATSAVATQLGAAKSRRRLAMGGHAAAGVGAGQRGGPIIISAQSQNDLPASFSLATSISDVTTQQNQLSNVVQQWAKKDSAAATSAVESANLTDQQRTDLLKTIEKAKSVN